MVRPEPVEDAGKAQGMAMRYLSRREYACQELLRKLCQRGVLEEVAGEVVERLSELDLVNDSRLAESFSRQRFNNGFGPSRIRAELRSRGVSDARVAVALTDYEDQWYEAAFSWAQRKVRGEFDKKARARLYRTGMNRGFSHDQVMRAIDRLRAESEQEQSS